MKHCISGWHGTVVVRRWVFHVVVKCRQPRAEYESWATPSVQRNAWLNLDRDTAVESRVTPSDELAGKDCLCCLWRQQVGIPSSFCEATYTPPATPFVCKTALSHETF